MYRGFGITVIKMATWFENGVHSDFILLYLVKIKRSHPFKLFCEINNQRVRNGGTLKIMVTLYSLASC